LIAFFVVLEHGRKLKDAAGRQNLRQFAYQITANDIVEKERYFTSVI